MMHNAEGSCVFRLSFWPSPNLSRPPNRDAKRSRRQRNKKGGNAPPGENLNVLSDYAALRREMIQEPERSADEWATCCRRQRGAGDAGIDPAHLWTDKAGRFLLAAYYVAAKLTVHAIEESGELRPEPVQSVPRKGSRHPARS
jgi:hypothetical protein